jgi:predicted molibdopterin-dependent oxidoreductase YjgC
MRAAGDGGVAIVASAHSPNEELYLLRRLARTIGASLAGVSWSPEGSSGDELLLKADKNPNTRGLALLGLNDTAALEGVLGRLEDGSVRVLLLHRADLVAWGDASRARRALERAPYVVVLDTHASETAQYGNVVLPVATYAEGDGTFTNHAGRIQRFQAAVPPPGNARAGWEALLDLLSRFEPGLTLADAAQVFVALAAEAPPLAGLDYERLGSTGVPIDG